MTLTTIKKAGLDEIALDHVFTIGASGTDHYTFQGEGLNGTVNDPTLYLTRGKTYRFENGTGAHAIRIQSADDGTNGTLYNTGVTNNNTTGTVIVEVQHDAPDVLYYQCASHANMKGTIYVTGAVADGSVTVGKIADNAVITAKIANDAVTGAKLADNAVVRANITDGEVISAKLDSNAVTTSKINNNAITTAKIATNAVTSDKMADNSVANPHIISNAVTTAKIADQAVDLTKLPHGTSSNDGKFLRANNGADPSFETVTSTTINNNGNNRVIIGTGTANTIEGESDLTFTSNTLDVNNAVKLPDAGTVHFGAADTAYVRGKDSTDGYIKLGTNGTDRITVDDDGRVGINRTDMASHDSDAQTLVVGNDATNNRAGITIHSSASNTGTIYFADGTGSGSYKGRINYYHNTDTMKLGAGGSHDGLHIDSNCVVTTPNRPAFMAKLGQNAVINNGYRNYTNSDGLKVGGNQGHYLTTVDFNQGSHYNSSTTRFTAPVAGLYYFEVVLSSNSTGPSSAYLGVELYKNGTRYYSAWQGQSSGYQKVRQAFYLELSANDYVEPGYESQQTVNVIGDSAANKFFTYFTGYLIG